MIDDDVHGALTLAGQRWRNQRVPGPDLGTALSKLPPPRTQPRRPAGRRRTVLLAASVAVVVLISVITSVAISHTNHLNQPAVRTSPAATTPPTPPGWQRYEYGMLSVAVPAAWRISTVDPGNCGTPAPHTLTNLRLTELRVSSCPAQLRVDGPSTTNAVIVQCMAGASRRAFTGGTVLQRKNGVTIKQEGSSLVYALGPTTEQAVLLIQTGTTPNVADLGPRILASIRPHGQQC